MGIYVYTLRNKFINAKAYDGNAEDITVGVSKFAYKVSGRCEFDGAGWYNRIKTRMWNQAEKVRRNNPDVKYIVMGDPAEYLRNGADPMFVYEVGNRYEGHEDGRSPGPVIGDLIRTGRKIYFRRWADKEVIPMSITN